MSKKKIKNKLPELLEAVCKNKDCSPSLKDAIWDAINNEVAGVNYSASYWRSQLQATPNAKWHKKRKLQMYGTENPTIEDIEKSIN